jgi:hypothetical protein
MPAVMPTIILATLCFISLAGAETVKPPVLAPNQVDAEAIFARQAGTISAPTTATAACIGAYLWSGRADISYRPFFQWELKLCAGSSALSQLRMRITTYGPNHQTYCQGHWQKLPDLAAQASSEVSYRLNCTIFPVYYLELQWAGGAETFIAGDKGSIPIALSPLASQGFVMAVNLNAENDADHPGVVDVTWSDWNVGGKPAKGIIHTLHLYNAAGKIFKDIPNPLPKTKELAVDAVLEQHWHLKVPAYATCSMSVEQADESQPLEAQGFSAAKDIEVAFLHAEGKELKGKVHNGLPNAQDGVVITITLQDAKGADLKNLEIPVGHLDIGATVDISAPLPTAVAFAGYATSWKAGDPSTSAGPPLAIAPQARDTLPLGKELSIDHFDGLTFAATSIDHTVNGLLIHGTLHNRTGHDLTQVRLRLGAFDGDEMVVVQLKSPLCKDHAEQAVAVACPLANISNLFLGQDSEP